MTLYDLTSDYLHLLDLMGDPDIDIEVINDTLEALDGEIEAKADGYAMIMKELEASAEAIKKEEERLYARRKSLEERVKHLKNKLQESMELTGKTKFKTALFSFGIQNNAPSVVIDDESKVPAEYWVQKDPEISKTAIKDYLKGLAEGETCEFAHLTQTQSLRIK